MLLLLTAFFTHFILSFAIPRIRPLGLKCKTSFSSSHKWKYWLHVLKIFELTIEFEFQLRPLSRKYNTLCKCPLPHIVLKILASCFKDVPIDKNKIHLNGRDVSGHKETIQIRFLYISSAFTILLSSSGTWVVVHSLLASFLPYGQQKYLHEMWSMSWPKASSSSSASAVTWRHMAVLDQRPEKKNLLGDFSPIR